MSSVVSYQQIEESQVEIGVKGLKAPPNSKISTKLKEEKSQIKRNASRGGESGRLEAAKQEITEAKHEKIKSESKIGEFKKE